MTVETAQAALGRSSSMDDLIAFLKARLDEDEKTARRIKATRHGALIVSPGDGESPSVIAVEGDKLLRGVAAKRTAINEYAYLCGRALNPGPYPQPDEAGRFEVAAMMTRALAAEWDDHPDYQESWKP